MINGSGITPIRNPQLHFSYGSGNREESQEDSIEEINPQIKLDLDEIFKREVSSPYREETLGLWQLLYKGTQKLHVTARKISFLIELVNPKQAMTCSMAYVVYLCNLYAIHKSLEEAQAKIIEKHGEGYCVFPALYRSDKILNDIQIWSIFNLPEIFADLDSSSNEFAHRVLAQIDPNTKAYLEQLKESVNENPLYAIGALYTFYGTILSGGQFVKEGVMRAYLLRIIGKTEPWVAESKLWVQTSKKWHELLKEGASYFNKNNASEKEIIHYFQERLKLLDDEEGTWKLLKEKWQSYLQEAVLIFVFPKNFSISDFKQRWHQRFDELPAKIKLASTEEEKKFSERLIEEANRAMQAVIDFIPSMQKQLMEKKLPVHPN